MTTSPDTIQSEAMRPESVPAFVTDSPQRDRILNEAARQFEMLGYKQVSMSALAERVGLAKATLYHYFPSKAVMLYAIHDQCIDFVTQRHAERSQQTSDPAALLRGIVRDNLDVIELRTSFVKSFFEYRRELPEDLALRLRDRRHAYFESCEDVMRRGVAEGVFEIDDIPMAARALFGMCTWTYQWFRADGPQSTEQLAVAFWSLFAKGIAPRAVAPSI